MFRIHIIAIASIIALVPNVSVSAQDNATSEAGFQRIKSFVQDNLIDRTLESRVSSKINHVDHGPSETEFFRRETFINFIESKEGIAFDCVSLIRQSVWPLDSEGKRSESPVVKDRVIVLHYGFHPSKAIDGAVGSRLGITSTNGIRPGTVSVIRATATDQQLRLVVSLPLFYDGIGEDGKATCQSYSETIKYTLQAGKLAAETHEEDFHVDPKTMISKRGAHDVTLHSQEVAGALAGIEPESVLWIIRR